jgi:hypothetical protein
MEAGFIFLPILWPDCNYQNRSGEVELKFLLLLFLIVILGIVGFVKLQWLDVQVCQNS